MNRRVMNRKVMEEAFNKFSPEDQELLRKMAKDMINNMIIEQGAKREYLNSHEEAFRAGYVAALEEVKLSLYRECLNCKHLWRGEDPFRSPCILFPGLQKREEQMDCIINNFESWEPR